MPAVFFVTQGQAYWFEKRDGYIWAPKPSIGDRVFWQNVELVKAGDVIIHFAGAKNGGISAISQAKTDCYNSPITKELQNVAEAGITGIGFGKPEGRRVDCDYISLNNTMPIQDFKSDILQFKRKRYSAFNVNGGICQGYLYELEEPLAHIFIERALKLNPYLKEHDFIVNILKILERN